MFKHVIALVIGALFSMGASAGYVRYDVAGPVSGHIIQHDTNKSIAYYFLDVLIEGVTAYEFRMNLTPQIGEGSTRVISSTTSFINEGPTNFGVYSTFGADQFTSFDIRFSTGADGVFNYLAKYDSAIYFASGWESHSGTHIGTATKGNAVDAALADQLDYYGGFYNGFQTPIIPTFIEPNDVPEPATLALLAIGALGVARARRRPQSAAL